MFSFFTSNKHITVVQVFVSACCDEEQQTPHKYRFLLVVCAKEWLNELQWTRREKKTEAARGTSTFNDYFMRKMIFSVYNIQWKWKWKLYNYPVLSIILSTHSINPIGMEFDGNVFGNGCNQSRNENIQRINGWMRPNEWKMPFDIEYKP